MPIHRASPTPSPPCRPLALQLRQPDSPFGSGTRCPASCPSPHRARAWLDARPRRVAAARHHPTLFPAVRRRCGRARCDGRTVDEAARALLLHRACPCATTRSPTRWPRSTATATPPNSGPSCGRCHMLDADGTGGLALVGDACAATTTADRGRPRPVRRRPPRPHDEYRHAVLKCLFCRDPARRRVAGTRRTRPTPNSPGCSADFAHERTAAGRPVPEDIAPVSDLRGPSDHRPDRPRRSRP